MSRRRHHSIWLAGGVLYAAAVGVSLILPQTRAWAPAGLAFLPPLTASILWSVRRAFRNEGARLQREWLGGALGCLLVMTGFLGDALTQAPFPSRWDVASLLAYPFLIALLLTLRRGETHRERAAALLDSLLLSCTVTAFFWYFVLRDHLIVQIDGDALLKRAVHLAFPCADILLALLALRPRRPSVSPFFSWMLAAAVLLAAADLAVTVSDIIVRAAAVATWLHCAATLCLFAAIRSDETVRATPPHPSRRRSYGALTLGFVFAIGVLIVLADLVDEKQPSTVGLPVALIAIGLMGLGMLRQALMINENIRLHQVVSSLLARAAYDRTDDDAVLCEALDTAMRVGNADIGVIWTHEHVLLSRGLPPEISLTRLGAPPWSELRRTGEIELPQREVHRLLPHLAPGKASPHLELTFLPLPGKRLPGLVIGIGHWRRIAIEGFDEDLALKLASTPYPSDRDSVTGLFNHAALHRFLTLLIQDNALSSLAVLLIDLDNFRLLNTTYGHTVGDAVLRRIATAVEETIGGAGTVARYGADELVVILPNARYQEARLHADAIRTAVTNASHRPEGAQEILPLSVSIGLAVQWDDGTTPEDLITLAQAYAAYGKQHGGNQIITRESHTPSLKNRSMEMLDSLIAAVDARDAYTRHHSEEVARFALLLADELGLSGEEKAVIHTAALVHDIGKIGVSDTVLRKPGRLTEEEFDQMRRHPTVGALILAGLPELTKTLDAVRHHHERWDGRGYPDRLAGEAIPFTARLIALADAFSAMTSDRPYRKGMQYEFALFEIGDGSGTQFDPFLTDAFLRAITREYGVVARSQAA